LSTVQYPEGGEIRVEAGSSAWSGVATGLEVRSGVHPARSDPEDRASGCGS